MLRRLAIVGALLVVVVFPASGLEQDLWYDLYERGERAFKAQQFPEAEQLFRRAQNHPAAPKTTGETVLLYSQVRGYIPEYYLAVICLNSGRLDEAFLYATTVAERKSYFQRADDPRLKTMQSILADWNAASVSRGLTRTPDAALTPATLGRFYALLIGIDEYSHQTKLQTAVADVTAMSQVLEKDFGFETRTLVNQDATRDGIIRAFNEYARTLKETDNLLIYYAGHGYRDERTDRTWWLPVNAEKDYRTHWILSSDVTSSIRDIPSRHILLIADSCYAGGLSRSAAEFEETKGERGAFLRRMVQGPSRSLMTSGGLQPVSDGGGGGHSVFARALLDRLQSQAERVFTANMLFQRVQEAVVGRSAQLPTYAQMRNVDRTDNADLDKGDFVFMRQVKIEK